MTALMCLPLKSEATCIAQLLPFTTIARLNGYNAYTRAKWQKAIENNGNRVVVTSSDNWLLRRQRRKSINTCFGFVSKRSLRYDFLSFFLPFRIFPELEVTLENKRNVGNSEVLPLVIYTYSRQSQGCRRRRTRRTSERERENKMKKKIELSSRHLTVRNARSFKCYELVAVKASFIHLPLNKKLYKCQFIEHWSGKSFCKTNSLMNCSTVTNSRTASILNKQWRLQLHYRSQPCCTLFSNLLVVLWEIWIQFVCIAKWGEHKENWDKN